MEISRDMMVYKNDPEKRPVRKTVYEYEKKGVNESSIFMNLHTGTHMDAPFHMQKDGETIEKTGLEKMITKAVVLDLSNVKDKITECDLRDKRIIEGCAVLLKTANSNDKDFNPDFIYLDKSGARYLADKNTPVVGIDSLGIERSQPEHETHKILMEAGCVIIEGLRLSDVDEGLYMMHALPLKIKGADGAPARVVLTDL